MAASFSILRELGLSPASSCLEPFNMEKGDLKRKRNSGDDSMLTALFAGVGTGVFEGVAWPTPIAFGGAVYAPNAWKPSQRASSRTLAVLA